MSDGWIVFAALFCAASIGFGTGVSFEEHRAQKKSEATEVRHAADLNFAYARGKYDHAHEINKITTTPEFTACIVKEFNDEK